MIPALALGFGIVLVAVGQAAAAPQFTIAAAAPAFGVLFLGLLTLYRGTRAGMIATPILAITEAWLRGLEPGLLLLAYAPVVPLIDLSGRPGWPLFGPGARLAATVILAAAWGRLVGAAFVLVGGTSGTPLEMLSLLLIPGAVVDALLAILLYAIFRTGLGEPGRGPWLRWS